MEISALHPFIVKPDGTFHVMLKEPPEKKKLHLEKHECRYSKKTKQSKRKHSPRRERFHKGAVFF